MNVCRESKAKCYALKSIKMCVSIFGATLFQYCKYDNNFKSIEVQKKTNLIQIMRDDQKNQENLLEILKALLIWSNFTVKKSYFENKFQPSCH